MDLLKNDFFLKFVAHVLQPAVNLLFSAAVVYFVYGVFTMIRKADDSEARIEGRNHILWSTVGLFIMISVWGIIALVEKTIRG